MTKNIYIGKNVLFIYVLSLGFQRNKFIIFNINLSKYVWLIPCHFSCNIKVGAKKHFTVPEQNLIIHIILVCAVVGNRISKHITLLLELPRKLLHTVPMTNCSFWNRTQSIIYHSATFSELNMDKPNGNWETWAI